MKNEAGQRIRYYGFVSYPIFSENSAKNDYPTFVVKFSKKSSGSSKPESFSAVGRRPFRTLISVLFPPRKRQRISNLTPVKLLNIPIFIHSVTY